MLVPTPERYAVHKLIVSRRRNEGAGKRDKDLQQSEALLELLVKKRPYELRTAWQEAFGRGDAWRQLLLEGLSQLGSRTRDVVLKSIDLRRDVIPHIEVTFNNAAPRYDFDRDVVTFTGDVHGAAVRCAISREALDDHFGADGLTKEQKLEKFLKNRSAIEQMAQAKYLSWPVEEPDSILIKTNEVSKLLNTKLPTNI